MHHRLRNFLLMLGRLGGLDVRRFDMGGSGATLGAAKTIAGLKPAGTRFREFWFRCSLVFGLDLTSLASPTPCPSIFAVKRAGPTDATRVRLRIERLSLSKRCYVHAHVSSWVEFV